MSKPISSWFERKPKRKHSERKNPVIVIDDDDDDDRNIPRKQPRKETPKKKRSKRLSKQPADEISVETEEPPPPPPAKKPRKSSAASPRSPTPTAAPAAVTNKKNGSGTSSEDLVGRLGKTPSNAKWFSLKDCLLIRTVPSDGIRSKLAAFDLDGTLLNWRNTANYPSRPDQYECYSPAVSTKLQRLYDVENYKLAIFANQGGIRGAFDGKIASRTKGLIDWLVADVIRRPVHVVLSTRRGSGHHKGEGCAMFSILEQHANAGKAFDLTQSFFVGDSAALPPTDEQRAKATKSSPVEEEGADRHFARTVGETLRNPPQTLLFRTPFDFFGPSHASQRKLTQNALSHETPPPLEAMKQRAALWGGYLGQNLPKAKPILLLLCGVQGSGKSTFSRMLTSNNQKINSNKSSGGSLWVHLSQDTIRNGKPGTRQAVEKAAHSALSQGDNVIIDRMHLNEEQRSHFIDLGLPLSCSIHALFFDVPSNVIEQRVKQRTNHEGGIEGERGAKMALSSLGKVAPPTYKEEFALIHRVTNEKEVKHICDLYKGVGAMSALVPAPLPAKAKTGKTAKKKKAEDQNECHPLPFPKSISLPTSSSVASSLSMPMITLGTMGMGKKATSDAVSRALELGIGALDTAPTYGNEEQIGIALAKTGQAKKIKSAASASKQQPFVIIKVPGRAVQPSDVRQEVKSSLSKLNLDRADLCLLHWPCHVMEASDDDSGSSSMLVRVWREMEQLQSDGLCSSIGVSNFNIGALRTLLSSCSVRPVVNQIERHPLLPQWDLIDFCSNVGIVVQAHTALGQGSPELLEQASIQRISSETNLSPAQVVMCWNLFHDIPVVVKSANVDHLQEMAHLVVDEDDISSMHLTSTQMKELDSLGLSMDGRGGDLATLETKRFVAPPFMYRKGSIYSWGDFPPKSGNQKK